MKHTLVLVAALTFTFSGFAQNSEKAKEILDKVSQKTKSYNSIKADFSFTLDNQQEEISETYDGSIVLKGNKYKVLLMGAETYFDGKTIWTFMTETDEVNISEPDLEDESSLNPATIFTMYEKGFNYEYVTEKSFDGKAVYEIDLFPALRDKPYSRIKLLIDKNSFQLVSIIQIGKDGNIYTIKVSKMATNEVVSDDHFIFNVSNHPNVEIIDMR